MHRDNRLVTYGRDDDGKEVAFVTLWDGAIATLYADALAALTALGFSTSWSRKYQRPQPHAAIPRSDGKKVIVARLLMESPEGTIVDYLDGNALNLRRSNLVLKPGRSKSTATDAIREARQKLAERLKTAEVAEDSSTLQGPPAPPERPDGHASAQGVDG